MLTYMAHRGSKKPSAHTAIWLSGVNNFFWCAFLFVLPFLDNPFQSIRREDAVPNLGQRSRKARYAHTKNDTLDKVTYNPPSKGLDGPVPKKKGRPPAEPGGMGPVEGGNQ